MKNKIRSLIFEELLDLKSKTGHYWIINGKVIKVDDHISYIRSKYKDINVKYKDIDVFEFPMEEGFIRIFYYNSILNIEFRPKSKQIKKNLKPLIKVINEYKDFGEINLELNFGLNKFPKVFNDLNYKKAINIVKKYM